VSIRSSWITLKDSVDRTSSRRSSVEHSNVLFLVTTLEARMLDTLRPILGRHEVRLAGNDPPIASGFATGCLLRRHDPGVDFLRDISGGCMQATIKHNWYIRKIQQ
jgi:hypothetical protein